MYYIKDIKKKRKIEKKDTIIRKKAKKNTKKTY